MYEFTEEQQQVINHLKNNDGILMVSAGPGTGKSFLSEQTTRILKPKKGLYTAFNKAIVQEGIKRFTGTNMECRTLHSLAYRITMPSLEIQEISYNTIQEDIEYQDKQNIIRCINEFCLSASLDMEEYFDDFFYAIYETPAVAKRFCTIAKRYMQKMIDEEMSPSFGFLLKHFHFLLSEGEANISYDFVIMDEINDTTAVALEIFKLLDAPKKLGIGDPYQAIYEFMNLVNGFELLEKKSTFMELTHSFRCSTQIAEKIEKFMQETCDSDFVFKGTNDPVANGKTLFCTSTNASIVKEIFKRLRENKGFHLLRNIQEIFAYPLALITASRGKSVYQHQYKFLEKEYRKYVKQQKKESFFEYIAKVIDDQQTTSAVNLLYFLKRHNINIFDLYREAKEAPIDFSYTIATVYTSKGLEYETVYISDSLNNLVEPFKVTDRTTTEAMTAYKCYYVACSRAGKNLLNATQLSSYTPNY